MPRWFNTAGPCEPADHYMLPAVRRLPEVRRLINQKGYFVVHAPRQVGKTTALLSLARELVAEGQADTALASLPSIPATWLRADGRLDTERLLESSAITPAGRQIMVLRA